MTQPRLAWVAALVLLIALSGDLPAQAQAPTPPSPDAHQKAPTPPPADGQNAPTPPSPDAQNAPTPLPPVVIDIVGSPALGPVDAPVTIVEFGDFQCPFCARGARALRQLQSTRPGQVRWVFKHFPLGRAHPDAPLAHEAAIAAQEQGKFWEMHERLFQTQRLGYDDLLAHAGELGLDMTAFKNALDTRRYRSRVVRDQHEAKRVQVFGTPTYFVNGTRIIGARSAAEFARLVDALTRPLDSAQTPRPPDSAQGATTGGTAR